MSNKSEILIMQVGTNKEVGGTREGEEEEEDGVAAVASDLQACGRLLNNFPCSTFADVSFASISCIQKRNLWIDWQIHRKKGSCEGNPARCLRDQGRAQDHCEESSWTLKSQHGVVK